MSHIPSFMERPFHFPFHPHPIPDPGPEIWAIIQTLEREQQLQIATTILDTRIEQSRLQAEAFTKLRDQLAQFGK